MSLFVSVIVCAYNEEELLSQCIESLVNQAYAKDKYEIIIVDDESEDKTPEIAKRWIERAKEQLPRIKYICIKHAGLSVARNTGIKHSEGEIIAFIDGDAVADKDWMKEIVKAFSSDRDVNLVGGSVLLLANSSKFGKFLYDSIFSLYIKQNIIGTNMSFRREFLESIGGFNEHFERRGDETCIFRIWRHLIKQKITSNAVVYHKVPHSFRGWIKTRYDNGYFQSLIDHFVNSKHRCRVVFRLFKKATFVGLPVLLLPALLISPFVAFLMCIFYLLLLGYRHLCKDNIFRHWNNYKQINNKISFLKKASIFAMIFVGNYVCEVGYLRGALFRHANQSLLNANHDENGHVVVYMENDKKCI